MTSASTLSSVPATHGERVPIPLTQLLKFHALSRITVPAGTQLFKLKNPKDPLIPRVAKLLAERNAEGMPKHDLVGPGYLPDALELKRRLGNGEAGFRIHVLLNGEGELEGCIISGEVFLDPRVQTRLPQQPVEEVFPCVNHLAVRGGIGDETQMNFGLLLLASTLAKVLSTRTQIRGVYLAFVLPGDANLSSSPYALLLQRLGISHSIHRTTIGSQRKLAPGEPARLTLFSARILDTQVSHHLSGGNDTPSQPRGH